ncbi:MAG: hypothetical protein ACKEQI_00170, partial [Candidatus Hodgkinia cicadicola]
DARSVKFAANLLDVRWFAASVLPNQEHSLVVKQPGEDACGRCSFELEVPDRLGNQRTSFRERWSATFVG